KKGDEEADPAISHKSAGEYNCQHGAARTESHAHETCDGGHRPAVLHELSKQRAEEKNRKELHDEAGGHPHKRLGPIGEQRLSGQSRGKEGGGRRQQQHAPPSVREKNQETESGQNAKESHAQILSNKTSRSKVECRPKSDACVSKKTCADFRPSACRTEKNSHS